MSAPTTAIDGTNVKISWTAPSSNYETITAYKVFIETISGTFVEETTYCTGTNLYCSIPMSVLWASPYLLTEGNVVSAEV